MAGPGNRVCRYSAQGMLGGTVGSTGRGNIRFCFNSRLRFCLFGLSRGKRPAGAPCSGTKCVSLTPTSGNRGVHERVYLSVRGVNVDPRDSRRRRKPKRGRVSFHCSSPLATTSSTVTFGALMQAVTRKGKLYTSFSPGPVGGGPNGKFRVGLSIGSSSKRCGLARILTNVVRCVRRVAMFLGPRGRSCREFKTSGTPQCVS